MDTVSITGMGVVSPAGRTLKDFWNRLVSGQPVYGPLPALQESVQYRIQIGAQLSGDPEVTGWSMEKGGKAAGYCLEAAAKALADAGLSVQDLRTQRVAVIIGTTMGEIQEEEAYTRQESTVPTQGEARFARCYPSYHLAHEVAAYLQTTGPRYVVPAACAAGNYAIAMAKQLLDGRHVDLVLAGGVDVFSLVAFAGFQRLLSLAPTVCQPFDRERKGMVLGEGCGVVVMERTGERRGKQEHGRVLGAGLASNAYHMTAPHTHGEGELTAMRKALQSAGLCAQAIDYISAHGTGTKANDRIEALAVRRLFGDRPVPPISSIKSMLGHSMGAASLLEVIACCLMMEQGVLLPTVNYHNPDEACPLDVVPNRPREGRLNYLMSNSFAFGGQTSCVVLQRAS